MELVFDRAQINNIPEAYSIIEKRVQWMENKGIRQWNTTDYLNTYPIAYFEAHQKAGNLYIAKDAVSDKVLGLMVLMPHDTRWEGYEESDSYFVHNFATDPEVKDLGSYMLEEAEKCAKKDGKIFLRLDCPYGNSYLNNFYQQRNFLPVGECIDGPYHGVRREKRLSSII